MFINTVEVSCGHLAVTWESMIYHVKSLRCWCPHPIWAKSPGVLVFLHITPPPAKQKQLPPVLAIRQSRRNCEWRKGGKITEYNKLKILVTSSSFSRTGKSWAFPLCIAGHLLIAFSLTVGEVTQIEPLPVLLRRTDIFTESRGNQRSVIFAYLTATEFLPTGSVYFSSM